MNLIYIGVILALVLVGVIAFWRAWHVELVIVPLLVAGAMALAGLVLPVGKTTVEETRAILVEKTPYRVIVTAFETTVQRTDAYSVAHADQIVGIKRTLGRNAYGLTLTTSFDLIFAESAPSK